MALITKFVNCTKEFVEVMEGIEGVYRSLGRMRPQDSRTIMAIKNVECDYLLCCTSVDAGMIYVSSNIFSESKEIRIEYRSEVLLAAFCTPRSDISGGYLVPSREVLGNHFLHEEDLEGDPERTPERNSVKTIIATIHLKEIETISWLLTDNEHYGKSSRRANMALEIWASKEKVFRLRIDSSLTQIKEQYTFAFQWIIAFYAVFHGVLLSVVSNSTALFICTKIYVAYILSALISLIAIVVVVWQLKKVGELEEIIDEYGSRLSAVCNWQLDLRRNGKEFKYGNAEVVNYRTSMMRTWWRHILTRKTVIFLVATLACSAVLWYIMHQLKC